MDATPSCGHCRQALPLGVDRCPSCGAPVVATVGAGGPRPTSHPAGAAPGEFERRLERLRQWREAADALGVEVPSVPRWVEARSRREPSEGWGEVIAQVEQNSAGVIAVALGEWEKRMKIRLDRLEAFAVDGRLERGQIDDALDAAKKGEAARTVASCRQVERVITLKERYLDQAREEIERVVSLLRDMEALGLSPAHDPDRTFEVLEEELRHGRLAPLKQRLRSLRAEATHKISEWLPGYVSRYGTFLLHERKTGALVDPEVAELARGARALYRSHPDEALHRLRALADRHPVPRGSDPAG